MFLSLSYLQMLLATILISHTHTHTHTHTLSLPSHYRGRVCAVCFSPRWWWLVLLISKDMEEGAEVEAEAEEAAATAPRL